MSLTDLKEEVRVFDNIDKDNFSLLQEKAEIIEASCEDLYIDNLRENLKFSDYSGKFIIKNPYDDSLNNIQKLDFSPHAIGQLCTKLGIPVRYINKCFEQGEISLVADNLNTWIEKIPKDKTLLFRQHEDRIRGVLSDKFSIFDSTSILNTLSNMGIEEEYRLKSAFLNDERLHLRMIDPEPLDIKGEDLFAGIQIDSSDVGKSLLKVQFFIHKLVCTNGLTIKKAGGILYEQKHIGIKEEEFIEGIEEGIELIPKIVAETRDLIINQKQIKIVSLDEWIEKIKTDLRLSEDSANNIINLYNEKYVGGSKWDLINSITEEAQRFNLDRRIDIEEYAGSLLVA